MKLNRYLIVVASVVLAVMAGCSPEPKPGSQEWFSKRTAVAIDSLIANPQGPMRDSLASWPADVVVPALQHAVATDSSFKTNRVRSAAFAVMAGLNLQSTPEGQKIFLAALTDSPQVAHTVSKALLELPATDRDAVAPQLIAALDNPDVIDDVKASILFSLKDSKAGDADFLRTCQSIFADNSRNENLRTISMRSILHLGGLDAALPLPERIDSTGQAAAIFALQEFAGITRGTFNASIEKRDEARQLVLNLMTDPSSRVRNGAFRAAQAFFGDDWFPISNGKPRLNPQIKAAIGRMIEAETDSTWRERLKKELVLLQQQEDRAAPIPARQ